MILQAGRYPVKEVCLHTAATPGDWWKGKTTAQMRDEIRRWHLALGWRDIGYHRVIGPDGVIEIGRSIYDIGAGVAGHNRGVVHLCMIPVNTHAGIKEFADYFTKAQGEAVRGYIAELRKLTPIEKVTGHNQYAAKECPGFWVKSEVWL